MRLRITDTEGKELVTGAYPMIMTIEIKLGVVGYTIKQW